MVGKPLRWRLCLLPLQTAGGVHTVVYMQTSSDPRPVLLLPKAYSVGPAHSQPRIDRQTLWHLGGHGETQSFPLPAEWVAWRGGREEDKMDHPCRIIQTNTTPPPPHTLQTPAVQSYKFT
ncbi:unnamed protein product [Lota lota]